MRKRLWLVVVLAAVASLIPVRPADAAWHGWVSLGGVLTDGTGVAATSWGPNRIDLFVNGTDGGTWHKWWDGRSWNGWVSIGGCSPASPTAVSTDPNTIDVFVVGCGASTSGLWHNAFRNGAWSGWRNEGGSYIAGLAATTWHNGRWDVFTISPNNRLNHVWFDGSVQREEVFLPNDSISMVSATSWAPGRLDVFAINRGIMQHRYYDQGSGWGPAWETLDDIANRGLGSAAWGSGRLDVFTRGNNTDVNNGRTFHIYYDRGWTLAREDLGGYATSGTIGATSWSAGRVDVFVHGGDDAVWHKYWS